MLKRGSLGRSGWLTLAAGAVVTLAAVFALRTTTAPSGASGVPGSSDAVVAMTPLSADDPLGLWMRSFAQTLGTELGGDLGPGTIGKVNGAVTGVYRQGAIGDFAIRAESAVISAGGVVTSRSLASQSVHARFVVSGQPSRVEITLLNGRLTIVLSS